MQTDMNHEPHHTNVLSPDVHRDRLRTQETAQRMTILAVRQWERALGGLLAIPTAIAVTTAAGAMIITSLVERTFEVVELTTVDVGRRLGRDFDAHGEPSNGRLADRRETSGSASAS